MGAEDKVVRTSAPKAFIQFSGDPAGTLALSRLIKYFLEGSMYRVEYLTKDESTTLKVFEDD
jgi:hypothetical protein